MSSLSVQRELALAGRVVESVRRLAGTAAQAEAVVDHSAGALTRFANSAIHQNVADATTAVRPVARPRRPTRPVWSRWWSARSWPSG